MSLITVSIVSHGHASLISSLLPELMCCPEIDNVMVTYNIDEPEITDQYEGRLLSIRNATPKGFGANHNSAFELVETPYYLVLNPDIRIPLNPFPVLLEQFQDKDVALCAPAVINPQGVIEDSARQFPTITGLFLKSLHLADGRLQYDLGGNSIFSPWVGGMFMLFRSDCYASLSGFNEKYYLYYEDVDICERVWRSGYKVILCPEAHVIHDARRASRGHLRHMIWHVRSMFRYLNGRYSYKISRLFAR